jgi:hypothetical protein
MARPQHINPGGQIRRVVAQVPEPLAQHLEKVARKRGVPVAQIIREQLEKVA